MMRGASARTVTLEFVEHLHARGMRRLHGCDIYVGARRRKCQCDIWGAKDGRLLVHSIVQLSPITMNHTRSSGCPYPISRKLTLLNEGWMTCCVRGQLGFPSASAIDGTCGLPPSYSPDWA